MAAKFNPGDLVELKSGGPVMTVESLDTDHYKQWNGSYRCSWFSGAKDNHRTFAEAALKKSDTEE